MARISTAATLRTIAVWLAIWILPLLAVAAIFGRDHVLSQLAWFFSKLAVVTFGGAYAVLAYMSQEVVHVFGWPTPQPLHYRPMFAAYGKATARSAVTFVSSAFADSKQARKLGLSKDLVPVENVRGGISKASMIHNGATPKIEVDAETYRVTADGEHLVCEPAKELPMAQRYFLF